MSHKIFLIPLVGLILALSGLSSTASAARDPNLQINSKSLFMSSSAIANSNSPLGTNLSIVRAYSTEYTFVDALDLLHKCAIIGA